MKPDLWNGDFLLWRDDLTSNYGSDGFLLKTISLENSMFFAWKGIIQMVWHSYGIPEKQVSKNVDSKTNQQTTYRACKELTLISF